MLWRGLWEFYWPQRAAKSRLAIFRISLINFARCADGSGAVNNFGIAQHLFRVPSSDFSLWFSNKTLQLIFAFIRRCSPQNREEWRNASDEKFSFSFERGCLVRASVERVKVRVNYGCFILQQRAAIDSIIKLNNLIDKITRTKGKVSQLKLFCGRSIDDDVDDSRTFQPQTIIQSKHDDSSSPPSTSGMEFYCYANKATLFHISFSPHARDGDHQPKIIAF